MKDENMLKKKDFDDAAVVAALRRGHRQRLYFEQIAVFRHKLMNLFRLTESGMIYYIIGTDRQILINNVAVSALYSAHYPNTDNFQEMN